MTKQTFLEAVNNTGEDITYRFKSVGLQKRNCAAMAYIGYKQLQLRGFEPTICFGNAFFSVNKSKFGIISFGDHEHNELVTNGQVKGHYWLEYNGRIIDFTLLFLHDTVNEVNRLCPNEPTGPVNISTSPIVSRLKIKPYKELYKGKLGYCYDKKKINCEEIKEPNGTFKEFLKMMGVL